MLVNLQDVIIIMLNIAYRYYMVLMLGKHQC